LIDAFIITAVFGALIGTLIMTLQTVNSGKVRTAATSLASEQMEKLRNLPYDSLSTQHGTILPQGDIPDTQTLTRSGTRYDLTTTIISVDDPLDGCAIPDPDHLGQFVCTDGETSATQDIVPVDYKRISIGVSQAGSSLAIAKISSDTAAKAAETPSNTGMLLVIVNNALGQPIEGATVTITNTSQGVYIQALTNILGYVFVANVPPDHQNGYHIVTTKDGYSTDNTTSRTAQNPNQVQPDVDIYAQQVTTQTLAIDHLATYKVSVKNESGGSVTGLGITVTGGKLVATNPDTPKNTYTATTDGVGEATFSNIEWDSYQVSLPSGYYLAVSSPYQPVAVDPNATITNVVTTTTDPNFPRIESVNPNSGNTNTVVQITIEGANFLSDTTVILRKAGFADLSPTATVVNPNQKTVTVDFNLSGAATGPWDIVVTTSGKQIIEESGFIIS
jgi:hypothetical protein